MRFSCMDWAWKVSAFAWCITNVFIHPVSLIQATVAFTVLMGDIGDFKEMRATMMELLHAAANQFLHKVFQRWWADDLQKRKLNYPGKKKKKKETELGGFHLMAAASFLTEMKISWFIFCYVKCWNTNTLRPPRSRTATAESSHLASVRADSLTSRASCNAKCCSSRYSLCLLWGNQSFTVAVPSPLHVFFVSVYYCCGKLQRKQEKKTTTTLTRQ